MATMAEYRTTDIYIASYLLASGFERYRIEKSGSQSIFVFEDNDAPIKHIFELEVDEYYANNVSLPPKKLFNAYKELKSRIFNKI